MPSAKPRIPVWVSKALVAATVAGLPAGSAAAQTSDLVSQTAFRVCADPANLPMSDEKGQGFENRIAELFAQELGLPLEYTWYPMATGFVRQTLQANACDVVIGYAQGDELVLNTNHYYTSAFVLIVPGNGPLAGVTDLSDPALKQARLGVIAGTGPASHLARNGLIAAARPYQLFADRRFQSPAADMLADLKAGTIDGAILWGPIGGPLAKEGYPEFKVTPLLSETLPPHLFYRITMGVRQGEKPWSRELNSLIRRNQDKINAILEDAGVPLVNDMGTALLDPAK